MNEEELNLDPIHPEKKEPPKREKGFLRELIETILLIVVIFVPIRFFVAQPFIVVGNSMYPTFSNGDYLIVDEISYRFEDPKRGEVIVFRPPVAEDEYYIKRIVGLPEETVIVTGGKVTIKNSEFPDGFPLEEKYASSESDRDLTVTLRKGEYFVMGDNRAVSYDSRVWGPLSEDSISGRALVRLFPLTNFDLWPGKEAPNE